MPPGSLQIAGGYYMIESGSCGGALITTKSECEAAATALDLLEKTAYGVFIGVCYRIVNTFLVSYSSRVVAV